MKEARRLDNLVIQRNWIYDTSIEPIIVNVPKMEQMEVPQIFDTTIADRYRDTLYRTMQSASTIVCSYNYVFFI